MYCKQKRNRELHKLYYCYYLQFDNWFIRTVGQICTSLNWWVSYQNCKTSFEKNCFSAWASTLNVGLINKGWYSIFVACGIWCLADISSVSPSSEQNSPVCSDEGLTLETSAKHHIPQATNIPYQPLLLDQTHIKTATNRVFWGHVIQSLILEHFSYWTYMHISN